MTQFNSVPNQPIPATIVTGFLGAGKTTLINRLLNLPEIGQVALIENEFGAVSIDSQLLGEAVPNKSEQAVTIIELNNGCICCSIQGEMSAALLNLIERRATGELSFQRLIIETTGLADPAPIAQAFFTHEQIRDYYQLDGVLTVVDAIHGMQQLDEHRVCAAQIGFADCILLSKTDTQAPEQLQSLTERLSHINPRANLYRIMQGTDNYSEHQISVPFLSDWRVLLSQNAFHLSDQSPLNIESIRDSKRTGYPTYFSSEKNTPLLQKSQSSWADDISSLVLQHPRPINLKAIGVFVEELIERHGNDLLRYKGILAIQGKAERLIFQGVHKIVGFDYGSPWSDNENPKCTIVLIGRMLNQQKIEQQFKEVCAQ